MRHILITTALAGLMSIAPAQAAFDRLGVLGDSLSDIGRLAQATSDATFGVFSVPADPYFEGRFSNGPIWVDYYSAANPGIDVGSLAVGGAFSGVINGRDNAGDDDFGAVPAVGALLQNAATGLDEQLALVPDVSGTNTAFVLWIGANDINSATRLGFASPSDVVPLSLANVGNAIDMLLGLGAAELYVANIPDIGQTPSGVASGQAAALSAATQAFNAGVATAVANAGPAVRLVDIASAFEALLADPGAFGFSDVTTPCVDDLFDTTACANPEDHLFWDTLHPTTGAHAIVADVFSDTFAAPIPLPAGLWLLGPAAGWLLIGRRRSPARR